MINYARNYFIIFFIILAVFITARAILLTQQNGFFTLLTNQNIQEIHSKRGTVRFAFTPRYDNLGGFSLPLQVLASGNVRLTMTEVSSHGVLVREEYTSDAISLLPEYPFGFVPIQNSHDKTYTVDISSDSSQIGLVKLTSNVITMKFTSPREKLAIFKLLLNKIVFIFSTTTALAYLIIFFISFAIDIIFLFIYTKSMTKIETLLIKSIKIILPLACFSILIKDVVSVQILTIQAVNTLFILWIITMYVVRKMHVITKYVSISIFIASVFALVIGKVQIGEMLVSYFWLLLLLTVIGYLLQEIRDNSNVIFRRYLDYQRSLLKVINRIGSKKIILLCLIIIFLVVGLYKTYYLGGDDSRLFYLYPQEFFSNYITHSGPNSAPSSLTSWIPPSTLFYFVMLNVLFKNIVGSLNLQSIMYMANFLGGIYFFYLFTGNIVQNNGTVNKLCRFLGSLLYVFSIFNYYTLYNAQLISQFLLSLFPLTLYLFFKAINEKKIYYIFLISLLASIFCYISVDLPWLLAAIIGISPIIIYYCFNNKLLFIKYVSILLFMVVILNIHWISSLSYYSAVNKNNGPLTSSSLVSVDFREQNAEGIKSLAGDNTMFYPLLNLYNYSIQENYRWPYLPIFVNWYLKILPINCILFGIFLSPIFLKYKTKEEMKLYLVLLLSFLISCYFFAVNVGNWGINLFTFLNNNIPGFVMFRNMYDKFGLSMAFTFALLMTMSLQILLKNFKYKKFLILTIFVLIVINAKPYLMNEFNNLPIWTTSNSYNNVSGFNFDFLNLVHYIKSSSSSSRYLWVPLSFGNVVQIQDQKLSNHFYAGVSPLLFLTRKNDYSGILSFETYADELQSDILSHREESAGNLYKKMNVGYIIINNTLPTDITKSYLCGQGVCNAQDDVYKKKIFGEKIKDFGSRYSLYAINEAFKSNKIYLTTELANFTYPDAAIIYEKKSDQLYAVHVHNLKQKVFLVLLDTYYEEWKLYSGRTLLSTGQHFRPFNYANGWLIDPQEIKKQQHTQFTSNSDGSINFDLTLRFPEPFYVTISEYISFGVGIGLVIYLLIIFIRKKQ